MGLEYGATVAFFFLNVGQRNQELLETLEKALGSIKKINRGVPNGIFERYS